MRIRKIILMAIKGDKTIRARLKVALDISEPTLYRILSLNHDDLTKATALKVIREETGLSDQEILEEEKVVQS